MKKLLFTLSFIALLCAPAWAGTDYNRCFGTIDSDYDGEMTTAEFKTAFPQGADAMFQQADADKNGTVSHEEWEDFKSSKGFEDTHEDG